MRIRRCIAFCAPIIGLIGACSVVSTGLGDDGSPVDDTGVPDATSADAGAIVDLGGDAIAIDALDGAYVEVAETGIALDTLDARDTAVAPDTAPPPLCSGDPEVVACYRFENDGFARQPHDESLYGNHGVTFSAVSFVPGVHGSAIAVGAASLVKVLDSASLDVKRLTVELRFRPAALPTGTRAGLLDDDGQYGMFIMNGGKLRCSVAAPTPSSLDSPGIAAIVGKWTHVACAYDGVAWSMYVDGVAVTSGPASGDVSGAGTNGIAIGMNSPSGDNFLGEIDDLRIWRRALTAAEICASASDGKSCP